MTKEMKYDQKDIKIYMKEMQHDLITAKHPQRDENYSN